MSNWDPKQESWYSIAEKDRLAHDHEMRIEHHLFEREMIEERRKDELKIDIREIVNLMIHAAGMLRGFDYLEKKQHGTRNNIN